MNSAKVIVILALFLTMEATFGEPPAHCSCFYHPDDTIVPPCYDRGCSAVANPTCSNGDYARSNGHRHFVVAYGDFNQYGIYSNVYSGCSCPGYPYSNFNGFYIIPGGQDRGYNYASCTDYAGKARDARGHVPVDVDSAVDCCNYCCNRNDSYFVGNGHRIILDKWLYMSGLTIIVLTTLNIN